MGNQNATIPESLTQSIALEDRELEQINCEV